MSVPYDLFTEVFLDKIKEYKFLGLDIDDRTETVDGYMKRAISAFKKNCKYDFSSTTNDTEREFNVDVKQSDIDELVDIITEGMVVHWLKPYVYNQDLLENTLNTKDYSTYSPSELLKRVGDAHEKVRKDYTQMIREYSFNHGDLSDLHL